MYKKVFLQEHFSPLLALVRRFSSSLARPARFPRISFVNLRALRGYSPLIPKHAGKDLVHVLQLAREVEGVLDLLARNFAGDFFVGQHELVEVQIFFPGAHGVRLHEAVGVLAADAVFDQVEQQLSAEDQAARALEVGAHALGIDEERVDRLVVLVRR